jgi:adenosylhomocysteine nucleosidase
LLPGEIIGSGGTGLPTAPVWRERLVAALAGYRPIAGGKLLTSPKAIASRADKARLFRETGAVAVDMESLAIAEVANARRLPFMAVRVIIDGAEDALPRAVMLSVDAAGHLHLWRLISALARAPADVAPLIRLARRYRVANRALATVARLGSLAL